MHLMSLTFTGLGSQYACWCRVKHSLRRVKRLPVLSTDLILKFWLDFCRLCVKWNKLTSGTRTCEEICVAFRTLANVNVKVLFFFFIKCENSTTRVVVARFQPMQLFWFSSPFESNLVTPLVFSRKYCPVHFSCSRLRNDVYGDTEE